MNFEQIISFVTDMPKQLLSGKKINAQGTPGGEPSEDLLHTTLKKSTKGMKHIRYTLERLEQEFMTSFDASNHQKNKQAISKV
jgi:hypothetical protein